MKNVSSVMHRGLNGLRSPEGRAALRHGVVPSLEHQALLRALGPTLVFDVGANRGQFSLDVRRALPNARVVAFEPLGPEAALYRSILGTTPNWVLHQVALGERRDVLDLHVSAARDSSSLLPIGQRQGELFPGTGEVGTERVEVRTLDDFLDEIVGPQPALLKIDVQGGELSVLRGGRQALERFRWVYVEISFMELYEGQPLADEVVDHLRVRGFRLAGVGRPSVVAGMPVQVDALFERT
jgi:FkbM family methyltransferase